MEKEIQDLFEHMKPELLTEDVKLKISTLIESKVNTAIDAKTQELNEAAEAFKAEQSQLLEAKAVEYVDKYLVGKIDEYLDYVAEEYMKENALAIESGLKSEMYDSLISDLKTVMAKNQITEEKSEEISESFEHAEALSDELNEVMLENVELKKAVKSLQAVTAFNQLTEGMTVIDRERVKELSAHIECDDVQEFSKKVAVLKESVLAESAKKEPTPVTQPETTPATETSLTEEEVDVERDYKVKLDETVDVDAVKSIESWEKYV